LQIARLNYVWFVTRMLLQLLLLLGRLKCHTFPPKIQVRPGVTGSGTINFRGLLQQVFTGQQQQQQQQRQQQYHSTEGANYTMAK